MSADFLIRRGDYPVIAPDHFTFAIHWQCYRNHSQMIWHNFTIILAALLKSKCPLQLEADTCSHVLICHIVQYKSFFRICILENKSMESPHPSWPSTEQLQQGSVLTASLLFHLLFCPSPEVPCQFWWSFIFSEKMKNQKVTVLHYTHIHLSSQRNRNIQWSVCIRVEQRAEPAALAVLSLCWERTVGLRFSHTLSPTLPIPSSCPSRRDLFSDALDLRWSQWSCPFARTQPVSPAMLQWCALPTRPPTAVSTLAVQTISHPGSLLELLWTYKTVCGVHGDLMLWCPYSKNILLFQIQMNYYLPRLRIIIHPS